jgi:DNA-binding FadR family transcriptional regulator
MKRDLPAVALDASAVAQRIRDALRAGHWPPGGRLPTERAMAESLGLSRAAVRKALATLKNEGLISQRVGSGTYAKAPAPSTAQIGPAELMRARIAFEPQIAELAVHNATAADFARMDECLAMAEQASSVEDFELWDARLHEALAEATHNAMVVLVFRMMSEARRHGEWGELKRRSASRGRRQIYQREHSALVQALRERDALKGAALLREHLRHVEKNLFSSSDSRRWR